MGADRYGLSSGSGESETPEDQRRPLLDKEGTTGEDQQGAYLKGGGRGGGGNNDDETAISVSSTVPSGFNYNTGHRSYRDVGYTIAFLVFLTASLGVGIFAAVNRNPEYQSVESAIYDHRGHSCSLPEGPPKDDSSTTTSWLSFSSYGGVAGAAVEKWSGVKRSSFSDELAMSSGMLLSSKGINVKLGLYALGATLILSAPLAIFLLWVLRTFTKELVYITLPVCLVFQIAFFLYIFWPGNLAWVAMTGLSLFYLWGIYKVWDRVELSIRIIQTASEALRKNPGLLLVLPGVDLVYLLYLIPAGLFLFLAYTNGHIIANPDLVENPTLLCGGSSGRPCCVWQPDAWVPAYITLGTFAVTWAAVVVTELHVFTVSGTISQWYFATTQSSTVGTTKRALGQALGPSFGTVCFSGLLVAIIRTIRSAMESSEGNRGEVGCMGLIVRACLECIVSSVEFLTKFTTNFAAITGEGFCASASMTFELLKRNFLSTVVVESVAGRLLVEAATGFAVLYGLVAWGVLALIEWDLTGGGVVVIAIGCAVLFLIFSAYVLQILHNVIDTVYICYAMDKDNSEVSKPEVHDVYVLLPAADSETASLAVPRSSTTNRTF